MKQKKCKECNELFNPFNSLQKCCSTNCAVIFSKKEKERKESKEWQSEKKKRLENIKTHSEWLKDLQKIFNTYIRERDKGLNCVSCGSVVYGVGNASHFFSVGSSPNLRFNEDNVHLSCIECNLYKHGNLVEYTLRLPKRIGQERFDKLISEKDKPLKLSIEEIKEKINYYKQQIKLLK